MIPKCPHCANCHEGACPRVKRIEYHENGTVKSVEYHPPVTYFPPVAPAPSAPWWPPQTLPCVGVTFPGALGVNVTDYMVW